MRERKRMYNVSFNTISASINNLFSLVDKENNLRNVTLYTETDNALHTMIALKDCKADTKINRVTYQVFDENTKRNATVYIYFKKDNKAVFECSDTYLKEFKASKEETTKRFKQGRTNVISTNYESTLKSLLALHKIVLEEKKASTTKKTTAKKATTKAVKKTVKATK